MAGSVDQNARAVAITRARGLVMEALDLLDGFSGSQAAAAHLALALEELRLAKPPNSEDSIKP